MFFWNVFKTSMRINIVSIILSDSFTSCNGIEYSEIYSRYHRTETTTSKNMLKPCYFSTKTHIQYIATKVLYIAYMHLLRHQLVTCMSVLFAYIYILVDFVMFCVILQPKNNNKCEKKHKSR